MEEQELIQAGAAVAPRVTLADIQACIASEHYFTAHDGCLGEWLYRPEAETVADVQDVPPSLALLTFCVLALRNGFTVTGESACASPANFNAEVGRKIARENAVNKIWPLLGYELKSKLAGCAP